MGIAYYNEITAARVLPACNSSGRAGGGRSGKWAYYNDMDPYVCEWVRNLIKKGHIPDGIVDSRSIADVQPDDVREFAQCHWFCGIAGWPLAAQLAGWPDDLELWTGSCPCQPFSVAGKQRGTDDDRHLWPHQFRLIRARRPAVWVGEQVAAAVGKHWLDGVLADLESIDYAGRAVVVPACAIDGPHRRDRIWIVAERGVGDADSTPAHAHASEGTPRRPARESSPRDGVVVHGCGTRLEGLAGDGDEQTGRSIEDRPVATSSCGGTLADDPSDGWEQGIAAATTSRHGREPSATCGASAWSDHDWIICHDGKARRIPVAESGIRLLAHVVSGRVAVVRPGVEPGAENEESLHWYSRAAALKGLGNAIVPTLAAEVLRAYLEARGVTCRP